MLSEPPIIHLINDFNLKSAEVIVHREEESLLEFKLCVKDLSSLQYIGRACDSDEQVVEEGEVLH
jgi:hypothetical protein